MPKYWQRALKFLRKGSLKDAKKTPHESTSDRLLLSSPNDLSLVPQSKVVRGIEVAREEISRQIKSEVEQPTREDAEEKTTARFTLLYDFPFEIRQEIYFWILQYHEAECASTYCLHGQNATHPTVPIATGPRHPQAILPFWGSKAMSSIFPLSKQWYTELQHVLYSRYTFEISTRYLTPEFTLGFLPSRALRTIRQVHIMINLDWKPLLEIETPTILLQAYKEIASNFLGLQKVKFSVNTAKKENHFSILGVNVARFVRTVVDIHETFHEVKEVQIVPWPERYTFPYSNSGYFEAFGLLKRECGRILEADKSGVRYIPMNLNHWKQGDGWVI